METEAEATPAVEAEAASGEDAEVDVDLDDIADDGEDEDNDEDDDEDLDDDEEDDAEDEVEKVAPVAVAPKPVSRPQPGRPPSAKDEPPPPFDVGERVMLTQNSRPRTGTPIGEYPVGATGRVETVLSLTAIVRFDEAPDIKEVIAFSCLESLDEAAKARRKAEAEAEEAAARAARAAESNGSPAR
ncbi:MAG TPA: hypothetical protein VE219_07070 [Candidatus Sulfotelmatobacter sp.]|nr:hypothetical protein [Candidatus Sulfotelmatobacter sp.]